MASDAERHLRGLAVDRLRELLPAARIIHELNVQQGFCRVDLAAIDVETIVFVEIKSRKDTLDRLPQQTRVFRPHCHELVVCYASERWSYQNITDATRYRATNWPEDRKGWWTLRTREGLEPGASNLLNLLWRDELAYEARRAGLDHRKREPRWPLINLLARNLTGIEATRATCRQLRGRYFPAGDPPILPD